MSYGQYQQPAGAGGFFTRTIGIVLGIVVGLLLVIGICVGIPLLVCGGGATWFTATVANQITKEAQEKGKALTPFVLDKAKEHGVTAIEDGATAIPLGEVGAFSGTCVHNGQRVPISATFHIPPGIGAKDFANWEMTQLEIDEKVVFSTEPAEE